MTMTLKEYLKYSNKKSFVWKGKAKDLKKLLELQKRSLKVK